MFLEFRYRFCLVLLAVVVCTMVMYVFWPRKIMVQLMPDMSQVCTNQIVGCVVNADHPGLVALGYNRQVRIVALDLRETKSVTVQLVNFMSRAVEVRCVTNDVWDVDFDPSGRLSPGGWGWTWMSIWLRETDGDIQDGVMYPEIELHDENGDLLCELQIDDGAGWDVCEGRRGKGLTPMVE